MNSAKRTLSRRRVILAFLIALLADGFIFILGPLGWTWLDEIVDVVAALLLILLLGFHPLFLPAFLVELIPVVDMLPTWTGCVAVVVALRRKSNPEAKPPSNVIDI